MNYQWKPLWTMAKILVVVLIMLEAGTRIWLVHFADRETFRRYASLSQLQGSDHSDKFLFDFHRYLGYIPAPNYRDGKNRHNSLGFRGEEFPVEKPAGEYRIVCIGASTTYTSFIEDYRLSYPYLLEQELHHRGFDYVKVINSGVGGWTSYESLINLQFRLLELKPDLIIVYHSVNDITARFVWPPEAYRGDNSGRLKPRFSRVFMPAFYEYSTLLRVILIRTGTLQPHAVVDRLVNTFNKETYFGEKFLDQMHDGSYPQGIFTQVSAMDMLKTNKPVYFENNIRSMVSIARNNKIDVLLVSFAVSEIFTEFPKSSSKEYLYAYQEHNDILRKIADQQKIFFFDYAKQFPRDRKYYLDGHHVTEEGARLQAKLFADYLESTVLMRPH